MGLIIIRLTVIVEHLQCAAMSARDQSDSGLRCSCPCSIANCIESLSKGVMLNYIVGRVNPAQM